jgi:hypothetical protein
MGDLSILHPVKVIGPGSRNLIISGNNSGTVLQVFNITEISGLTIANGSSGGLSNWSRLVLTEVAIQNNAGGGLLNAGGPLTITRSTISNNSGGGITIRDTGDLASISNSTISGNDASFWGGGILAFGRLTVNNVTVANNRAGCTAEAFSKPKELL